MANEESHRTSEVFGIARDLPLNYVARDSVDGRFVENLTRDKHIVIYGSSKQGKTSLRKHCLEEDDYITVHCSNRWNVGDVNSAILKGAGYEITQSTKKSSSGRFKVNLEVIGFEGGRARDETSAPLELDIEDVNDTINALKRISFEKYIVLEDFHYLTTETQRDFAVALKAFHEASSICFIIVGVWLEENRLVVYNGDLTGRVVSVDADTWREDQLKEVITEGEYLLNVNFDPEFVDQLIAKSSESVYLVQEACHKACVNAGVLRTCEENKTIGSGVDVEELVRSIVNEQSGRYNSFLTQFADGFQDTELQMYRWILFPILTLDIRTLQRGLRLAQIRSSIVSEHPRGLELNTGNITQALLSTSSLQVKKDIKPIILDYDQTNVRLSVVDKSFLTWLGFQDRTELLSLIELPLPGSEPAQSELDFDD